jgi:penicillin-binding protein 1C
MAKAKAKKIPNEKSAANKKVHPLKILSWVLASIGKPLYFVLAFLVLIFISIFILSNYVFKELAKKVKELDRSRFRYVYRKKLNIPKFSFPKIKLPQLKFPDLSFVKLEELKVGLLELKISSKIKGFFVKELSRSQKFKLKIRIRYVLALLLIASLSLSFYFFILRDLPSPKKLTQLQPQVSTKIYDRNGNLLYKIYKDQNRTIVPLSRIPVHVRLATLAAEDAEFYSNPGFSVKGIFRALIQDIKTGSLQGGSTITQQLVKNTLLTPEKTLTRKIKELILSIEVEATYTKDQILDMYLNEIGYGGTAYGIEEASQEYFGKDVQDLDLAQAAYLAGLTKSPTTFSPYGQTPELGFARQKEVLHLMVINKFITEDQANAAANEKLIFAPNHTEIKAPHFVMYIRQLLVDKYGEDMVEEGGLEVTTSLDLPTQEMAEKVVHDQVAKIRNLNVGNGAALVMNPQTGEILSMVGSQNYFDTANDGNVNVLTRLRQPGSSIKVVNYAYALSHGYTPATIINDSPITFNTPGSPPYSPRNYDSKFVGNIPLRYAFAQSRNVPAVKVLASYGVSNMVAEGKEMGISTWDDSSQYGLSLTLGGGAVTGLDLAKVYATVANGGKRPDLMPILQVKDYKGRILEKDTPKATPVLDERVAFLLTDILKDNAARAPEFGLNSYLVIRDHPEVAVKTGTSNDLRDNWTVGYNQNYLVLTWVGNNDNSPMSHIASGITGASPIWNQIMSAILNGQTSVDWNPPPGVSRINICTLTGTLPCAGCPTRQEWFLDENKPTKACSSDQIQNILNPTPIPPGNGILDTGAKTQFTNQ